MPLNFLGYQLFEGNVLSCAEAILHEINSGRRDCKVIACLNPHSYVEARKDVLFKRALGNVQWLIPDGIGIVIGARWLGCKTITRTTGPDVFQAVMSHLERQNGSVFFLGSSDDTLNKIVRKMSQSHPSVMLAGTLSPPFAPSFTEEENLRMIEAINLAGPDALWVGMTAPKQEKWLEENRHRLNVPVAGAIGAAFDFYAETVQRPPPIFQKMGLEWLPRLFMDPRRLWKRMGVSAPIFLGSVLRARLIQKR